MNLNLDLGCKTEVNLLKGLDILNSLELKFASEIQP